MRTFVLTFCWKYPVSFCFFFQLLLQETEDEEISKKLRDEQESAHDFVKVSAGSFQLNIYV